MELSQIFYTGKFDVKLSLKVVWKFRETYWQNNGLVLNYTLETAMFHGKYFYKEI